jgi:Putative gypsy type transposon
VFFFKFEVTLRPCPHIESDSNTPLCFRMSQEMELLIPRYSPVRRIEYSQGEEPSDHEEASHHDEANVDEPEQSTVRIASGNPSEEEGTSDRGEEEVEKKTKRPILKTHEARVRPGFVPRATELEARLLELRIEYQIPSSRGLRFPKVGDTIFDCPKGYIPVYIKSLEYGLRFPLHPLIQKLLRYLRIPPYQLTPSGYINIHSFIAVCALHGVTPSFRVFQHLVFAKKCQGWQALYNRRGYLTSYGKPDRYDWKGDFVYLELGNDPSLQDLSSWSKAKSTRLQENRSAQELLPQLTPEEEEIKSYFEVHPDSPTGKKMMKIPLVWLPTYTLFQSNPHMCAYGIGDPALFAEGKFLTNLFSK